MKYLEIFPDYAIRIVKHTRRKHELEIKILQRTALILNLFIKKLTSSGFISENYDATSDTNDLISTCTYHKRILKFCWSPRGGFGIR